jgi:hypothetical protein
MVYNILSRMIISSHALHIGLHNTSPNAPSRRRCSVQMARSHGKNPCLPHLPIEKEKTPKECSETSEATASQIKHANSREGQSDEGGVKHCSSGCWTSINHEAQQCTALKLLGWRWPPRREHIPKCGNGTTGIGNMRGYEPEARNQQAISYA